MATDSDNTSLSSLMNDYTTSGETSAALENQPPRPPPKLNLLPDMPDPDAVVIALSPKSLMGTIQYICEICYKGFQRDQNLQLHRRGHNLLGKLAKIVYICPEENCVHHDPSSALGDFARLKKHFYSKHVEKKWECDKCSKKYADQSDLKAHSKICGKKYKCDCGTLFSRKDSLIAHRAFCDVLGEESARIPLISALPKPPSAEHAAPPAPLKDVLRLSTLSIANQGLTKFKATRKIGFLALGSTHHKAPGKLDAWFGVSFGSNMPRQMLDAHEILPGQNGWTCIVQVIERHAVGYKALTSYAFQKRHKHYLLTDMKGTKIKAVMFDNDMNFFKRSLQPFQRYKISNSAVTVPPERYQLDGYKYSWIITTKIPVKPIADAKPYLLSCNFDVCKFAELHKFVETDVNIEKSQLSYDFGRTCWPLMIQTLTASTKGPVTIIASNLHVKTFHGLSLATRDNTYIIENPPLLENLSLNKWYTENKEKVADWLKNKAYEDISHFFVPPEPESILDLIAAMSTFENARTCWIKGTLCLSVTRNPPHYNVCGSCGIEVVAGLDWDVKCFGCGVVSPMKIKLPVTLNDENTNMRGTIKSSDAERLVPFTGAEIMKLEEE